MDRLLRLIGVERDLHEVARALYGLACEIGAPVTGALHVTCADETEGECAEAFESSFAEYSLPALKPGQRAPFRIANLGGRYEWGAVRIAEDHFALRASERSFKLMVVKINAHVAAETTAEEPVFGRMRRFGLPSLACGAIHALLDGSDLPFARDLRDALRADGRDRLRTLLDPSRVPRELVALFAAVASARVQAGRAVADILEHRPRTPTLYLVLPCVTLNRRGRDGELPCGVLRVDCRSEEPALEHHGLGDDPARYRLRPGGGRLAIEEE